MNIVISTQLNKRLREIKMRDKLALFQINHQHPSLRTHKLTGNLKNIWSISVDTHTRMLYVLDDEGAYFFDIGTHDEVYRK